MAVAALWAAVTAHRGLKAWRQEMHGRAEYDVARRTLIAAYRVRDALQVIRMSGDHERHGYPPARRRALHAAERDLDATLLEGATIWNDRLVQPRRALDECSRDLTLAFRSRRSASRDLKAPDAQTRADARRRIDDAEDVIWRARDDETDAFGQRLRAAVADVENALKPYIMLRPKRSFLRRLAERLQKEAKA